MSQASTPVPTQKQLDLLSTDLRNAAFEGEAERFDLIIAQYKDRFGQHDPHARLPLFEASRYSYQFSFRSISTDRQHNLDQRDLRIGMWFKHLPLDLQFSVMMLEAFGQEFPSFPLDKISWEQMNSVLFSPDPVQAYMSSPLCAPHNRENRDQASVQFAKQFSGLHRDARHLAWECLNHDMFDKFDEIMTRGNISPWDAVPSFMIHYRESSSRGYSHVQLCRPAPFWAVGVFFPSADQRYWEIMAKHGGPSSAFINTAPARLPRQPRVCGKLRASAPKSWADPMKWLRPPSSGAMPLQTAAQDYINSVIFANLSYWKAHSLSRSVVLSTTPSPKPKI